jgi:methylenetetrahydrofolate reductase (NADPH)
MGANKREIASFLSGFSIEVTPASASKVNSFAEHLPSNTSVNVTSLPGSDIKETINVSRRLSREGFNPVPHLAARNFESKKALEQCLDQLTSLANVKEVLVIAGGLDHPKGPYYDTMKILQSELLEKYSIKKVGVSGHPEGSPDITDFKIETALREKNFWARDTNMEVYIATQFCFEAALIFNWEERIRNAGNTLPIHIGLPGLATLKTLLKFAQMSGIGPSMRVLTSQTKNLAKLILIQEPDIVVSELALGVANNPDTLLKKVHFYPFGGLTKTAAWVTSAASGKISLKASNGFSIDRNT